MTPEKWCLGDFPFRKSAYFQVPNYKFWGGEFGGSKSREEKPSAMNPLGLWDFSPGKEGCQTERGRVYIYTYDMI